MVVQLHLLREKYPRVCLPQAVPAELLCESCQRKVLEAVGKMIHVLEEQMSPGVSSAVEAARNLFSIIGAAGGCHLPAFSSCLPPAMN